MPYLAIDEMINTIHDRWSVEWCTSLDLTVGSSNIVVQWKKEESKSKMEQMVMKRKEVSAQAKEDCAIAQETSRQVGGKEQGSNKEKSPS